MAISRLNIDSSSLPVSPSLLTDGSQDQSQPRQLRKDRLMRRKQQQRQRQQQQKQQKQKQIQQSHERTRKNNQPPHAHVYSPSSPDARNTKANNWKHTEASPCSESSCDECLASSVTTVKGVLVSLSELVSLPSLSPSSRSLASQSLASHDAFDLMAPLSADTHVQRTHTKKRSIDILQDHCRGFVDDQDRNLRHHDRSTELGYSYDEVNNKWRSA